MLLIHLTLLFVKQCKQCEQCELQTFQKAVRKFQPDFFSYSIQISLCFTCLRNVCWSHIIWILYASFVHCDKCRLRCINGSTQWDSVFHLIHSRVVHLMHSNNNNRCAQHDTVPFFRCRNPITHKTVS